MIYRTFFVAYCAFAISISSFSQNGDTINQVDKQGRKQGYWKKNYPEGSLMYEGYFKNNNPVGTMKRYYETGEPKVFMTYLKNSDYAKSKFFYDDGKIAGEGTYYQKLKDSLWVYYSYYSGAITTSENYSKGVKTGIEKHFYPNGQVSEEIEWANNAKNGKWNQYFENGKFKLKAFYSNNNINGVYLFYWPNGNIYFQGHYIDNKKHGDWSFFEDNATLKYKIVYKYGKAENEEVIIKENKEYFDNIEKNIGKFSEPTVEDLMPRGGY